MPRILKQIQSSRQNVDPFSLGADFDVPDGGKLTAELDSLNSPDDDAEAEVDAEALRLAVIEEARAEAAVKVKEAYAEGLSRGQKAGREAFDASVAEAAAMLKAASEAIQAAREQYLESLTPQVSALAVAIAEKVLRRAVEADTEHIQRTVREALELMTDRQSVTLRVHPQDHDALETHKIALLEDFSGLTELDIEPDDKVEPGGCIVESGSMVVDGTLSTLLEAVVEKMYDG